jgi:ethanolamine permease
MSDSPALQKTLGPVMLWALGVGYVISGMYFGWNLGLPEGGTYGLLVATLLVTVLYITFVMSYAELSCALPRAGGAFVYVNRGLGPAAGFLAGMAQCVEFVFAMPAIAVAIGAYFHIYFPGVPPLVFAFAAYVVFTGLNVYGVKQSAVFELVITVLAVVELLIFAGVTAPRFSWEAFTRDPLPNGWWGVFPAIPFAIWFYVCIEGVANVAEETRNPQKDLVRGFGTAMGTLVVLALLTFFAAVGVDGWKTIVYEAGSDKTSDSPLPLALAQVVGQSHGLYHLLIGIGLCGLVASFHGITLAAGRATFEFGRVGYAPGLLGSVHASRRTPAAALVLNMLVGFAAIVTGRTGEIITMAIFGALTMYVLTVLAQFRLRRREPDLERPFRTPLYPWVPALALVLSLVGLGAMAYSSWQVGLVYLGILLLGYGWFYVIVPAEVRNRRF